MNQQPYPRIDARFPVVQEEWREELLNLPQRFAAADSYWCFVRPGEYAIGGWGQAQKRATIVLPSFWIARFPITVAQYTIFMHTGYSSQSENWWTPAGWAWKSNQKQRKQPWKWDDGDFTSPDQPVIGVSWYEASVFANWLSELCGELFPETYRVRLPTEAEWEAAAAWNDPMQCQPYPWGTSEPEPSRVVFQPSNRSAPAPVGEHPGGAAACGAQGMCGNIWEWMSSSFNAYPLQSSILQQDFGEDQQDVPVRGGSWANSQALIHCGARDWHRADYYDQYTGFRLVVAPV